MKATPPTATGCPLGAPPSATDAALASVGPQSSDDLANTVILAGAGLSMGAPTCAPLARELVEATFDTFTGPIRRLVGSDIQCLRSYVVGMRLELFLEVLAREIPVETLVGIYGDLDRREPNYNHFAVASLGARSVLTTNQDLFFEEAASIAGAQVQFDHIHGRIDDPRSIVTLLRQLMRGMAESARAQMSVVRGREVVVMGYSGRDRDVMAALAHFQPRRVTWLTHPQEESWHPPPEVVACKRRLQGAMEFAVVNATSWLASRLSAESRRRLDGLGQSPSPRSEGAGVFTVAPTVFDDVCLRDRLLVVAHLFNRRPGGSEQAARVYRQILSHFDAPPRL